MMFDTVEQELDLEILKAYMDFYVEFMYNQKILCRKSFSWQWSKDAIGIGFGLVECFDWDDKPATIMSFYEFLAFFLAFNCND